MEDKKIKILFAASECTPYAKVGGLADVVGSLPKVLAELGFKVGIILPKYENIDIRKYKFKLISVFKFKDEKIKVYQGNLEKTNAPVYLLENDKYLSRGEIYPGGEPAKDFFLIKRFLFFSQLILTSLPRLNFKPQIIHCHDWQTAIVAPLLKLKSRAKKELRGARGEKGVLVDRQRSKLKTLLTIHNLPYQGEWAPQPILKFLGLKGNELETLKIRDKSGDFNILQQGILNADIINTVSPDYAKEILTDEFGEELSEILRKRKKDLYGILNGIDTEVYNPQTDKNLKVNYSIKDFQKKVINKIDLQKNLKLPENSKTPLFSFIGRLTEQKGIELIISVIPELVKLNCQLVILGQGERKYVDQLTQISEKFPKNISVNVIFNPSLAQKIYGGADFILMPSAFEPCGLVQMFAQRYGTIPIARATGGIKSTIEDGVSGFLFQEFQKEAFLRKIKEGLSFYSKKQKWQRLVKNAMKKDFSWQKSAKEYAKLYQKLLNE